MIKWLMAFMWLIILLIVSISCIPGGGAPTADKPDGVLTGFVSIGPLCPVEPCSAPVGDVYSSRVLIVKKSNKEIARLPLQPDGSFYRTLPADAYSLELTDCNFLGCSQALPVNTVVEHGKTTTLKIDIDTGIRSPGGMVSPKPPVNARQNTSPAPIDNVEILIRKSYPPQYAVRVVSGLPNSCVKFDRLEWERKDTDIRIQVLNLIPDNPNLACAQLYGMVENTVELGTDFVSGRTYTVKVNDVTKTFIAQ